MLSHSSWSRAEYALRLYEVRVRARSAFFGSGPLEVTFSMATPERLASCRRWASGELPQITAAASCTQRPSSVAPFRENRQTALRVPTPPIDLRRPRLSDRRSRTAALRLPRITFNCSVRLSAPRNLLRPDMVWRSPPRDALDCGICARRDFNCFGFGHHIRAVVMLGLRPELEHFGDESVELF